MTTNHVPTSRQKLFSAKSVAKATIAAATAITAGFLAVPTPAQAHPMFPVPLAPPCSQFNFYTGDWPVTIPGVGAPQVIQTHHGPTAAGRVLTYGNYVGSVTSGGIYGRNVDFTITFTNNARRHYTGTVGDDGLVGNGVASDEDGGTPVSWLTGNPLVCIDAPPPPAPPNAQTAAARLGVSANGPTTLPTGQSGTFTVNVSNSGDVGAPVELYVSYSGKLQQTGQVVPSDGFNCDVQNYAGGTSSVHCTVGQLGPKATATIVVQGRGSAPGAAGLGVNINSSDPAAQFVQKSQKLNVTIT